MSGICTGHQQTSLVWGRGENRHLVFGEGDGPRAGMRKVDVCQNRVQLPDPALENIDRSRERASLQPGLFEPIRSVEPEPRPKDGAAFAGDTTPEIGKIGGVEGNSLLELQCVENLLPQRLCGA